MKQTLADIPRNHAEERRRKGNIPAYAYLLVVGLFLALAAFYFPAWFGSIKEMLR